MAKAKYAGIVDISGVLPITTRRSAQIVRYTTLLLLVISCDAEGATV
mgnify:CR=1 FL=1